MTVWDDIATKEKGENTPWRKGVDSVSVCVWLGWRVAGGGDTSEKRACPFIDIFTYERSVSSDCLTKCTKVPGRSSPPQKKKRFHRENIHIPAATDPIETHCISLIRDTLSRLCLFSRHINVEPERPTLAAYLNPNSRLEATALMCIFQNEFLCSERVWWAVIAHPSYIRINSTVKSSDFRCCHYNTTSTVGLYMCWVMQNMCECAEWQHSSPSGFECCCECGVPDCARER